jgi:L-ascorbate metabolism protein UlaG (beta-lactamase superfamily)
MNRDAFPQLRSPKDGPQDQPRRSRKNPYYNGPRTDHFDGTIFFNPEGVPPGRLTDLLRWRISNGRQKWPRHFPSPFHGSRPEPVVEGDRMVVTMVGHATMLVQTAGLNFVTDPVWSNRASPVRFAGPKRVNPPGIAFHDLPRINAVLLSHNHYDHLDIPTLKLLAARDNPLIVTPLGNDTIVKAAIPDARVVTGDWGDAVDLPSGLRLRFAPAHHWSARGMNDRRMALWAAFVLDTPGGRIYHVGDTGFHDGINFDAAGREHGPFRLAILPVGAYEPRWFMRGQHMNPQEAVLGMELCNAAFAVGHHWGTFQLTDEAIEAPRHALHEALAGRGIDPDRFPALRPGESVEVPPLA